MNYYYRSEWQQTVDRLQEKVVDYWLGGYGDTFLPGHKFYYSGRRLSVANLLRSVWPQIVPLGLGGSSAQHRLGVLLQKLVVDADKFGKSRSNLSGENVEYLRDTLLVLLRVATDDDTYRGPTIYADGFKVADDTPERLSALCAV